MYIFLNLMAEMTRC